MSEHRHPHSETGVWPNLPMAWQHRISMKWLSLESLRVLQDRLAARGMAPSVLLLTSTGLIQGKLADIMDTYEASVTEERPDHVDTASAVTHLRTELWKVYAQRDSELGPTDSGALVHLRQAVLRIGGRRIRLPHLTVFASEIVGFALVSTDVV